MVSTFASDKPSKYTLDLTHRIAPEKQDVTNPEDLPFSSSTTDVRKWHLIPEGRSGRVEWRYLDGDDAQEQGETSRFFLGIKDSPTNSSRYTRPSQALASAAQFHSRLQFKNSGCWHSDMSCITFVTPMLIIAWYITEAQIPEAYAIEIVRYLLGVQNQEDHGWSHHRGGPSTLMGTIMKYIGLRLIGLSADHPALIKARQYILHAGGAVCIPSWAKFWLCLLDLYEWDGTDPYPTEIWLLPYWNPLNPWRWYCITRQAFLCMSFLSSRRFKISSNPLLKEIREEIFTQPYSSINFLNVGSDVRIDDRHQRKSWLLQCLSWFLVNIWTPWLQPYWLAQRAERNALELIRCFDNTSHSTGLVSIDQFLTMIVCYAADGRGAESVRRVQRSSFEYLFMSEKGMQSQSIHGAHTWETALALQTYVIAGLAKDPKCTAVMANAHEFLLEQQFCTEWPDIPLTNRFSRLGGWPFTTRYHGQSCSDCTAEALKAILMLETELEPKHRLGQERTQLAVDNLLLVQNPDGSHASFEPIRGYSWLEYLNGTELFGGVMVEHAYVECTASVVLALVTLQRQGDTYRAEEVEHSISAGINYIQSSQRQDGSWRACWGVGFTCSAFFALEALATRGETYENSETVKRACDFLISKMHAEGGWGETVDSILNDTYSPAKEVHTVQTAWACLALMYGQYPRSTPIRTGMRIILERQRSNGEWPQEGPCGAGVLTCLLLYHNYIYTFPMRALSEYIKNYGDEDLFA